MDRSWMMDSRMSRDYELGVEVFIQFQFRNDKRSSTIRCLYFKCGNRVSYKESMVRYNL